jgi:tRNA-guanine family transglycosylase
MPHTQNSGQARFSRAYMHPLDRCGEMLGLVLATIHNLHCHLFLMQEVRNAPKSLLFAKSLSIKVKLLSAPREYFLSSSGNGRLSALM